MTGAFEASGTWYLQAVGLPRNQRVQAVAILCTTSTLALALALREQHLLTTELSMASAGATVPAVVGMGLGSRWRKSVTARRFRRLYFALLLALGLCVLAQSFYG